MRKGEKEKERRKREGQRANEKVGVGTRAEGWELSTQNVSL